MGKYFDLQKFSNSVRVTPRSDYTGSGIATESVVVTAVNDSTVKATVVCTRTGVTLGLDYSKMKVYESATLDGAYTAVTTTINNGLVFSRPATKSYIKLTVPFNGENISVEDLITLGAHESYVKLWDKYLKDDGTFSDTRVKFNMGDATPFTIPGDPGSKAATTLEVIFLVDANPYGYAQNHEYWIRIPADDENVVLRITQAKAKSTLSVNPTSLSFDGSAAYKEFTVTSNDNWTATTV